MLIQVDRLTSGPVGKTDNSGVTAGMVNGCEAGAAKAAGGSAGTLACCEAKAGREY